MRLRAVAVLALLALVVACNGDAPDAAAPTPEDTPNPVDNRPLEADVELSVSGDEEIELQETLGFLVTEIRDDDVPRVTWFLAGGMSSPYELDDGARIRAAFDLRPGKWDGDGTYTLDEERTEVEEGVPQPFTDHAFLEVLRIPEEGEPQLRLFDSLAQPCTLRTERSGDAGSLDCPELAAADGSTISLRMGWDGRPA